LKKKVLMSLAILVDQYQRVSELAKAVNIFQFRTILEIALKQFDVLWLREENSTR
jgi:hypothetical protein